jgi:hypothetical protein
MSQEDVKAMETCEADQYNEASQKGFAVSLKINFFGMKTEI